MLQTVTRSEDCVVSRELVFIPGGSSHEGAGSNCNRCINATTCTYSLFVFPARSPWQ